MSPFLLLLLLPLFHSTAFNASYHIDCGSSTTSADSLGTTWLSDRYFTGGSSSVVSEPLRFQLLSQKTLRFFPPTISGKKNCYLIPVPPSSRFLLRTFIVYDNYDGKSHPPTFQVSVEGTVVFTYRSPWPESLSRDGSYSDLFAFVSDGEADVCFYSIATDPPVVASLEVLQVDPASYEAPSLASRPILVNYGRITCGDDQWGPGFTNDTDAFGRTWQSDADFQSSEARGILPVSTTESISKSNAAPNFFPEKLYQSAVTVPENGNLEYEFIVDARMDYLLWFHFAEIDRAVTRPGERVFDVLIDGVNVKRIDVLKQAGAAFSAFDWHYVAKNLSTTTLSVRFAHVSGAPFLSALENYALVPNDLSTEPDQVSAMRALKGSFHIPDRMGWNGDPCAPTSWDAWEGVTCRADSDASALVVSGIKGIRGILCQNSVRGERVEKGTTGGLSLGV
ncbi:hypothetical protein V2J09_011097 [Rumex salicifolius]